MNGIPKPWFRHFWPWFIVGLLGISVVASLATLAIAYRYGDVEIARTRDGAPPPTRIGLPARTPAGPRDDAAGALP